MKMNSRQAGHRQRRKDPGSDPDMSESSHVTCHVGTFKVMKKMLTMTIMATIYYNKPHKTGE